jgi:hypothetical protein
MTLGPLSDAQFAAIHAAATELFAKAVSQGMHSTFSLDAGYWGREYADRLLATLLDHLGDDVAAELRTTGGTE